MLGAEPRNCGSRISREVEWLRLDQGASHEAAERVGTMLNDFGCCGTATPRIVRSRAGALWAPPVPRQAGSLSLLRATFPEGAGTWSSTPFSPILERIDPSHASMPASPLATCIARRIRA